MNQSNSECPVKKSSTSPECPVQTGRYKNPTQYNVYSQPIDTKNNMPVVANQNPSSDQKVQLSTERVSSKIPKGGTDEGTWTYPSPQMFWNALVRKDKLDYTSETDIDAVVAIHNNMNENSWKQVMSWEKLHTIQGEGKEPKLLRFVGRPNDFSPKARLKMLFGHIQPFDRHDWVVDRGGVEVRYVLDYYHDESGTAKDRVPQLTDAESIQSIKVDVRPALDSITAITDRMWRMPLERYVMGNRVGYLPPPFFADKSVKEAEVLKKQRFREIVKSIENSCSEKRKKLDECDSEADCRMAGIAFQLCSAQLICPSVAADFNKCLHSSVDEEQKEIPKHLTSLQKCFEDFQLEYGERG